MNESADAIIVGAGVQGASVAFHLARRGMKPVVLEWQGIAAGATGRSSGFVMMHPYSVPEARLCWASLDYFRNWDEVVGGGCGFVRTGFLRIVPRDFAETVPASVSMHQEIGIPTLLVNAGDAGVLAPGLHVDDFDVASYEPESGYADPTGTATAFLDAARRLGATLVRGCRVTRVMTDDSRVKGVETSAGIYSAPIVVDAAGAWAPEIARTAGVDLPVEVWRHDVAFIHRPPSIGSTHPMVVDRINSVYFRPEGRELTLVALQDGNEVGGSPERETESTESGFAGLVAERLCRRFPAMAQGTLQSAHSGQDGITPDQRPILGQAGPAGFYVTCGFSGVGFKIAPAVGRGMAELITDGRPSTVEIAPFALSRFSDNQGQTQQIPGPPTWT